jgi:16S rRNA (cytosine1402-N4)-methyltransferase
MHEPVLLNEVMSLLAVRQGGRYLDGTLGSGGHASAILDAVGPDGFLLGIDRDPDALRRTDERLDRWRGRFRLEYGNFADMETIAGQVGMESFDGILVDLGVSSEQLDTPERGFSFSHDGPLDMRMNPAADESAAELIARIPEAELADVIWQYGEERQSRRIARAIVRARREEAIESTAQLAAIVERAAGGRRGPKHPATRTFQALRIAVNDELGSLERGLDAGVALLKEGGRLAVISFHSLEDRMVKRFFRAHAVKEVALEAGGVRREYERPPVRIVTRRPVVPGAEELERNARARSSKLRVAERIAEPAAA